MSDGAIAIVGASCRFPGAAGLEAFWRLLLDGGDAISEIGTERWSTRFFRHPTRGERGKSYSFAAGLIDAVDEFEPEFFGISPREAAQMDPQQRLLLELAWHAIEDAGIPAARLAGRTVGVYIGASSTDYGDLRLGDPASGDAYFVTGSTLSILANRISHIFDLRGPSLVVDTACSSSLVALHEACEALRGDRIEAAMVGGINLLLSPYPFIGFAQAAMLSPHGRCFAFDARADGYVRGEGGGIVVLKRLEQALADADPIRAVICGTGVSAAGRTIGLSLPSEAAQAELLRAVYGRAGIAPDALAFLEMHGTGTPAGDPIEAAAVGRVLGRARTDALPIGSVKTNIGHLEAASGMAGLLKAMLALEHGILPRPLHGETPNPAIPFDRLNLRLVGATEPITGRERYAGINSFGFGGTNAHAILAAPPAREAEAAAVASPPLLISARSEASLRALAEGWRDTLAAASPEQAPLLLRAAARRRDHHPHRLVALGDDPANALGDFLSEKANPGVLTGTALRESRIAFVYSGNGAQFPGMGRAAYCANTAFRDAIAAADQALAPLLGWSIDERIAGGVTDEALRRADIAQPMLFAIQVAVTMVLRGLGIEGTGFIGHSVGEIAAAWAAGALSLDDAARVVEARSRHQERLRGAGRMAVLALGEAETTALIAELSNGVEIAAVNSTRSVSVAGAAVAIAALEKEAARRGVAWRALDLDFAFHSAAMEPIRGDLVADLAEIETHSPAGDLVSTVTGSRVGAGALDAVHWWRNIRDPVRFADAAATLTGQGYGIFAEIGPNPVLQPYLRDALRAANVAGRVVPTLDRRAAAGDPFRAIAARLHIAGPDISCAAWFDGPGNPRGLPFYPWQRRRFWFGRSIEAAELVKPIFDHPLLGFRQGEPLHSWRNQLDTVLFPFLADHRIDGTPVLPATAIIDMALAAARVEHPHAAALELSDVELLRPIAFADGEARETRFAMLSPSGEWQLSSRKRLADEPMTLHTTGSLGAARSEALLPAVDDAASGRTVTADALYRHAARLGLEYGGSFRVVGAVIVANADRASVALLPPPTEGPAEYLIHPALLDGALQGLLALLPDHEPGGRTGFLPRRIGRVRAFGPFGRVPRRAELRLAHRGARSAAADIAIFDAAGSVIAELVDCWFARVDLAPRKALADCYLRIDLVPAPLDATPPPAILDRIGEILASVAPVPNTKREAEQALLFDVLVASIAWEAIRELGDPSRVSPIAAPLLERTLILLRRFGAASDESGSWQLVADNDLPDAGELWRSMLADAPGWVTELALLAVLREQLPEKLRDGTPFDLPSPLVAALQTASPPIAAGKAAIAAALDAIAAEWPSGRPLRLCEPAGMRFVDRLPARRRRASLPVSRATSPSPSTKGRATWRACATVWFPAGCCCPSRRCPTRSGICCSMFGRIGALGHRLSPIAAGCRFPAVPGRARCDGRARQTRLMALPRHRFRSA
jgi:phthiocerol/phenolphthiocerol synthesis type-I polyketide synthase C